MLKKNQYILISFFLLIIIFSQTSALGADYNSLYKDNFQGAKPSMNLFGWDSGGVSEFGSFTTQNDPDKSSNILLALKYTGGGYYGAIRSFVPTSDNTTLEFDYRADKNNNDKFSVYINGQDKPAICMFFFKDGISVMNSKQETIPLGSNIDNTSWHHLKVIADINNQSFEMILDGKSLSKGDFRFPASSLITLQIACNNASTDKLVSAYFDNFELYNGLKPAGGDVKDATQVTPPDTIVGDQTVDTVFNERLAHNLFLYVGVPFGYLNGEKVSIDKDNIGVTPQTIDGRTLLPARFVAESLGATVNWSSATSTITITKESTVISLVIGKNEMSVNGEIIKLDVPAQVINNRTLVPLRALSTALGKEVFWDGVGMIGICDMLPLYDNENQVEVAALKKTSDLFKHN